MSGGRRVAATAPLTAAAPNRRDPTGRWRWRLTARGVVVALTAVGCLVIGVGGAYPLATTIGGGLLAVVAVDLVVLLGGTWRWRRLAVHRQVTPNPVHAGQAVTVTWGDLDRHLLRGDIEQPLPDSFELLAQSDDALLRVRATRRGLIDLPAAHAARDSPFGLGRASLGFAPGPQVVVWPAVAPLDASGRARSGVDEAGRVGLPQANPDDSTVREYTTGDEFRRIHWRASARRGHLMTRAEEPARLPVAWVQPVVEAAAGDVAGELALALAASILVALADSDWDVGLTVLGQPVLGTAEHLLDHLAAFEPAAAADAAAAELGGPGSPSGPRAVEPTRRFGLTIVILAAGPGSVVPAAIWPPAGPGAAIVVGSGAGIGAGAWLAALGRAGWAPVAIAPTSPLDQAARRVGRALDSAVRGLR